MIFENENVSSFKEIYLRDLVSNGDVILERTSDWEYGNLGPSPASEFCDLNLFYLYESQSSINEGVNVL